MRGVSWLLAVLVPAVALAGVREVEISLPVRPKLLLTGHERVYLGPFIREAPKADVPQQKLGFDVAQEFERYLRRLLRRESKLQLLPPVEGLRPPAADALALARATQFWRELGSQTGADLIVAGSVDFQVQDRSGYKTEEYVSPIDGRTYYRQVLVEQTGFAYDILLQVYDGRTGALLLEQPLKDFQERADRSFDEFTGMFSNLYALENQLIGIFVPRTVKSKRILFTD
ncbi:hypothetical protein EG19_03785 [Thermoanaerobaculum aquaticum]|jgi:hypothetical protein|uniref:Uncharacterized protein n=1 Tax=Thermoanaerobaculum aquaticum TaxID=1312852 RepID=A0A062XVR6_9BACT|nr:hypothetical protein [Thermoanaerobaculum aquaticum]KDA54933.1 hypothetical protein EG19_03785 [Thermoanaerobaculum aquaticum]